MDQCTNILTLSNVHETRLNEQTSSCHPNKHVQSSIVQPPYRLSGIDRDRLNIVGKYAARYITAINTKELLASLSFHSGVNTTSVLSVYFVPEVTISPI